MKLVTPERMVERGVTPGDWSVKDILAHVLGWQVHMLGWHEMELGGGCPSVPMENSQNELHRKRIVYLNRGAPSNSGQPQLRVLPGKSI